MSARMYVNWARSHLLARARLSDFVLIRRGYGRFSVSGAVQLVRATDLLHQVPRGSHLQHEWALPGYFWTFFLIFLIFLILAVPRVYLSGPHAATPSVPCAERHRYKDEETERRRDGETERPGEPHPSVPCAARASERERDKDKVRKMRERGGAKESDRRERSSVPCFYYIFGVVFGSYQRRCSPHVDRIVSDSCLFFSVFFGGSSGTKYSYQVGDLAVGLTQPKSFTSAPRTPTSTFFLDRDFFFQ